MTNIKGQIYAAALRRDMKKARRERGLSMDLRALLAEYRAARPEYAEELRRIIYPSIRIASG